MRRMLKDTEYVKPTDSFSTDVNGLLQSVTVLDVGKKAGAFSVPIYRTEPEPITFDEVVEPMYIISKEPVDDYEISQHSDDEVIYATDTKADVGRAVNHLAGLAKDKTQEWKGTWNIGDSAMWEGYEVEVAGFNPYMQSIICIMPEEYAYVYEGILYNKLKPIKPAAEVELLAEIDRINAYVEQIDSKLSDYDIQMFAQYVIGRNKDN